MLLGTDRRKQAQVQAATTQQVRRVGRKPLLLQRALLAVAVSCGATPATGQTLPTA